jgi:hypothetical protein
MSADPFANTVTVKNILNHIISPKIVKDGSGGYTTKTDLVNIDNLIFASRGTTAGTIAAPLTAQVGGVDVPSGTDTIIVYHSRITEDSIIVASVKRFDNFQRSITQVLPVEGNFTITFSGLLGANGCKVSWFIASF